MRFQVFVRPRATLEEKSGCVDCVCDCMCQDCDCAGKKCCIARDRNTNERAPMQASGHTAKVKDLHATALKTVPNAWQGQAGFEEKCTRQVMMISPSGKTGMRTKRSPVPVVMSCCWCLFYIYIYTGQEHRSTASAGQEHGYIAGDGQEHRSLPFSTRVRAVT